MLYISIVYFYDGYKAVGIHDNIFQVKSLQQGIKKHVAINDILGNQISDIEILPLPQEAPIQVLSSQTMDQVINLN
jgi:hypothetical protein